MTAFRRASRFIAVIFTLLLPTIASAATAEFRVLLDVDNSIATGCVANGLNGIDQILVTRVEVNETESHVTETHRLVCTPGSLGSSFGPPTGVDPTEYPAEGGPGTTVVETRIAYSDLTDDGDMPAGMRVAFVGENGTATQAILVDQLGNPIIFPDPTPGKRRAIGAGGTRHIILDGETPDWGGIQPLAPGAPSGGTAALRIINVYGVGDGMAFYFRFDVRVAAEPPVANDDEYSVVQGQILSVGPRGVLSNDEPDPDTLSAQYEGSSGPTHGDLDLESDGSFTYAHDGTLITPDSFMYRAFDGALLSNAATVTINIIPNQPPVASNFAYSVNEGGVLNGSLLDHVSDPDSPDSALDFTIDTFPAHGSLILGANGSFTYTHDDTETPATDSFTFHVNDEVSASNIATITINITNVNDPPVNTVPGPQSTDEDTNLVFTGANAISIADPDAGANPVQVTLAVTNGTLTLSGTAGLSFTTGDGTADATMTFSGSIAAINAALNGLTFAPTPDYFGGAMLTITTNDLGNTGSGGPQSDVSNVAITVDEVNDAPSFIGGPDIFADSNAGPFTQANWATAIDKGAANESGQTLNFETVSNTNTGLFTIQPAIDPTTGTLTFTPVIGATGSATLVIQLRDSGGTSNGGVDVSPTDTFTITLDVAPTVASTVPANGATNQAGNTDLIITFSEPVNVAGNWFQIVCGTSGTQNVADTLVTGGTTVYTINPNTDFAAGETCTVTIFAAQVTDVDANDPPDNMAANYAFSFSIDAAPVVTSTVPVNGATDTATNGTVTVNFSEAVNATATSATIECPVGVPQAYTVSGSGTSTVTYTPTANLPDGVTCTVTILAAQITDVDANDPPDTMAADHVFTFTTDAAPAVTTTTPTNGATSQPTDDAIVVNFTEAVTATTSSFTIECPVGVPQTFTVGGSGTSTITLTPTADLPSAVTCTVTVIANQISDVDANDPPDNMVANYVFTFTTDAAPAVTTTTPVNGSTVSPNATITVNFTEAVTATTSSFTVECPVGSPQTFTVGGSGTASITLTPTSSLPAGVTCTVTVIANQISDVDTADRPDNMAANYVFTFDVDAIPAVTATLPLNGAVNRPTNTLIQITFSEAVNATATSATIECPVGVPQAYTVGGSGTTTITYTPTSNLPAGTTCTVTILAAEITDVDANDPPDNMAANYVFSFTTDAPPAVTTTTPANGATDQATNVAVTVNFNEAVNATATSATIECPVGVPQAYTVGGSGTGTITYTPTSLLPAGVTCTVTILAAEITDVDANDPPDNMTANFVFSFTTDAPPAVTTTTPTDTATGIATNTTIVVNFSEAVTATTSSFTVECPVGVPQTFGISGSGTSSITITPAADLPVATVCTVTVIANQISDVDANDPPDNMVANYVFTFTTDAPPAVTTTTPNNGDTVAPSATITVNFTEAVTATTSSFTVECPVGSPQTFTVGGSGTSAITLTPTSSLPAGVTCTVTVIANQISDSDAGDPPDNMVANYVFTFATDAEPSVSATLPLNGAVNRPTNTLIQITFSEAVNATATSATIECPVGVPQAYSVGGSGTATITYTPTSNLPAGTTCTVTILAAQITDVDANDPPDNMAANYVFSFTTDAPPAVTTTTPANGATDQATNVAITVNFSEAVNATATSATIECPVGVPQAYSVGGSGTGTVTYTPSSLLPAGVTCTVTILAAQITDVDASDPPDNMVANYVFSFTTDAAPAVTTTVPANGSTIVGTGTAITVNFTEAVTVTTSSFSIECPVGVPQTFTVGGSGTSAITLTPTANLPEGTVCTVTVIANQVSDVDSNDPPDNMVANHVFSFTTDFAPTVMTTTPANGATGVSPNATITVNFSEAVTATTSSFTIECPVGSPQTYTVGGSGTSTIVLTPTSNLPGNVICTVTVIANQISDTDAGDPPDNMAANYVFSFETDAPPSVTATLPLNGAVNRPTNTTIQVTFSEAVNATATSATIECPVGVPQAYTVGGSGTTVITYTPSANLPAGVTCTVTILAAQITDVDLNDPPDNMTANYVFTFSTDAQPSVTATSPTNGATNRPTNTTIQVTFSEAVNATATSATIECPVGVPQAYTVGGSGTTVVTYTPTANLPAGVTCTVTILAAQVTDVDANDPPDTLAANYVFTFSTDAQPSVTATVPVNGATGVGTATTIQVTFSEAVNATATSATIECPVGVPQAYTVGGSGTTVVTYTPTANLPAGVTCTVTILAAQVTDVDANDPPDTMAANHVFTFTTDAPPAVTTTVPANGADPVAKTVNIVVNFNEPVDLNASSFTIECPVGSARAWTYSGASTNVTTATLDPTLDLPPGNVCTVTVVANQVSDTDAGDPPNNMVANYVFTFVVRPEAVNDTYPASGNHAIAISAPGVMVNDLGPSITVTEVQGAGGNVGVATATTLLGSVILNADGSFVYDPPRGVVSSNDTFTYRVSNGTTGQSNLATVTINIDANIMWYVCDVCPSTNLGTLRNPYTSIANFSAANTGAAPNPQPGHRLYIRSGTYDNAADTLVLRANQLVYGQGTAASSVFTPAANTHGDFAALTAGARPLLQPSAGNGITLASGNTVQHLNVGVVAGTSAKIFGTAFGTLTTGNIILSGNGQALNLTTGALAGSFDTISSTSGTNNIALDAVTGTLAFTVNGGALSGATGHAVHINAGSVGFDYTGSISHSTAAFGLLNVAGGHTGTVTFNGTVSATGGLGLQFSNADGTYRFNNTGGTTTLNGGDAGIDILAGSGGTFSFAETTNINNPTNNLINIDASTPSVTYSGSFTKTNAGIGIDVTSNTGGSLTIDGDSVANGADGAVEVKTLSTTTGTAVNLTNNTGMAMTFSGGGLAITTTTGRGFNATGAGPAATSGGTVVVTGTVNTISSAGGAALYVEHTTIGAGGLVFRSIAANGGTNGILLNNTGSTAGLTVSGTGAANTGGTIQSTTGSGIFVTNTMDMQLSYMTISNIGSHGVEAVNLRGSSNTFTAGNVNNFNTSTADGFRVTNLNTNLGSLIISASTFQNATTGNDGVGIEGQGTSNMTVSIQGASVFQNLFGDGVDARTITGYSGTMNITVTGNTFQNAEAVGGNGGLSFNPFGSGGGTFNVTVTNNLLSNLCRIASLAGVINLTSGATVAPGPTVTATISGNDIVTSTGRRGVNVISDTFAGNIKVTVNDNDIDGLIRAGVALDTRDSTPRADFFVTNNRIGQVTALVPGGGDNGMIVRSQDAAVAYSSITNNLIRAQLGVLEVIYFRAQDNSNHSYTVTGNTVTDTDTAFRNEMNFSAGNTATECVNASGNQLGVGGVLRLTEAAGTTINVTQASSAAMAAANNAATITITGTPTFNQPACTTPNP